MAHLGIVPKFFGYGRMSVRAKKVVRGHVSPSGRLSLPAEFRKAVGLERGGDVVVELDEREIRIRTLDDAIADAQALSQRLLAGKRNASLDDFLRERKANWKEP
jgi:bifunctional DNA-binding transcriptional regulator/antitoxin component of YhaV-PrlF toxin-antitoxin module